MFDFILSFLTALSISNSSHWFPQTIFLLLSYLKLSIVFSFPLLSLQQEFSSLLWVFIVLYTQHWYVQIKISLDPTQMLSVFLSLASFFLTL